MRAIKTALITCAALLVAGTPAYAQVDFSGQWESLYHEDGPERLPGPELGDYLGFPINDAARLRAYEALRKIIGWLGLAADSI